MNDITKASVKMYIRSAGVESNAPIKTESIQRRFFTQFPIQYFPHLVITQYLDYQKYTNTCTVLSLIKRNPFLYLLQNYNSVTIEDRQTLWGRAC